MDDIVTRLRESAEFWSGTEYGADFAKCAEAADEIERLRNQVRQLEAERDQWQKMAVRNDS